MLAPTYFDWLTFAAIVVGPIVAVGITIWSERRRQKLEARTQILRMLLNTWAIPSDPAFTVAMNLILIEFNDQAKIMEARRAYIDQSWKVPTPETQVAHNTHMSAKLSRIIYEISKDLGFEIPESDLQTQVYVARGYAENSSLQSEALRAACAIAASLEEQTQIMRDK